MIFLLDGNTMPLFKRMSVKDDSAVAANRGLAGQLNVDRSYQRDRYQFEYEFMDIETYSIIKTLYERHYNEGVFFQMIITDTSYPLNKQVFIAPGSIVPRFGGKVLEGYTLELIER